MLDVAAATVSHEHERNCIHSAADRPSHAARMADEGSGRVAEAPVSDGWALTGLTWLEYLRSQKVRR